MSINPFDLVEPTWRSLSDVERGYWMINFGEALGKHEDHQGTNAIPPPLAGPAQIIDAGNKMIALATATEGGDRFRQAELDAYRPQADLQVSATVTWVVVKSKLENKPSVMANLHLEEKKEKKRAKRSLSGGVSVPRKLKGKRADEHSGTVFLSMAKDPYASMYYAQFTQGNPGDEASWVDAAQSDSCRNMEVNGLKAGEIYHFRVRCFGGGQYSPWSQILTLRVL